MSVTRKSRRRRERSRAKNPARGSSLSLLARAGLIAAGVVLVIAGAALLIAGGAGNAARLGRVAGILIIVGIVIIVAGTVGRR